MTDPSYSFRLSQFQKEATLRLTDRALLRAVGGKETSLPFSEIASVRVYRSPAMGLAGSMVAPGFERCVVRPRHGKAIVVSSNHFEGFGRFKSRAESFEPFVDALIRRVGAANPAAEFHAGMPMGLWVFWIVVLVMVLLVTPLLVLLIVMALMGEVKITAPAVIAGLLLLGILLKFRSYVRAIRGSRSRRIDPKQGLAAIGPAG